MRYLEDSVEVTVYQPDERQGGLLWALQQAADDLHVSRHIIWQLFRRDFMAQFRQKILGWLWALIAPLIGILSFLVLFAAGVLQPGNTGIPYPIYVLIGTTLWGVLVGSLGSVSAGLQNQADLILRTNIPRLALAVSSLAQQCYGLLINAVTIAMVLFIAGIVPSWTIILFPMLCLPLLLLGAAIGLVLAVLGAIARDLTPIVQQVLGLAMYITPVIYVATDVQNPWLRLAIDWNPLSPLIQVPRDLICTGHSPALRAYLLLSCVVPLLVMVALRVFYLINDLVAERL